jgi:hypothetical protein
MNKKSDELREQARRAERLALSVSDHAASQKLKDLSKELDLEAASVDETDEPNKP